MPEIPDLGATEISKAIPKAEVGFNADSGKIWQQLGGQVEQFATNLDAMQTKSDNESYLFNKKNQLLRDYSDFTSNLKQNTPANGAGYTQATQDWLKNRQEQDLATAPSIDAKNAYSKDMQSFQTSNYIDSHEYERTKAANFAVSSIGDQTDANSRYLIQTPDKRFGLEAIATLAQQNNSNIGIHYDEAGAKVTFDKNARQIALGYFEGLGNTEAYKTGMKELSAPEDPNSMAKYLSPAEKDKMMDQFRTKLEAKETTSSAEITYQASTLENMYKAGITPDPQLLRAFSAKMNSNSKMKDFQKQEITTSLQAAAQVSEVTKQLPFTPLDKWQNPNDFLPKGNDIAGASSKIQFANKLAQSQQNMIEQIAKDPLGFYANAQPDLRLSASLAADKLNNPGANLAYVEKAKAAQAAMGIPADRIRVTSESDTQYWGNLFNAAKNGETGQNIMQAMQNSYGSDFNRAWGEFSNSKPGKQFKELLPVTFVDDPISRQRIFDAVQNKKSIESGYVASDIKPNEIDKRVAEKTQDFALSFANISNTGSAGGSVDSFRDAIALDVKRQLQGRTSVSSDVDHAIDVAKENIIDSNFKQVKRGKSSFVMPNTLGPGVQNNGRTVKAFVDVYSKPENMGDLDVAIKPNSNFYQTQLAAIKNGSAFGLGSESKDPSLQTQEVQDRFKKYVANNGQWVLNDHQDGIALKYLDPERNMMVQVTDSKGNPVQKSFKEINQAPSPKVSERANSFWFGLGR